MKLKALQHTSGKFLTENSPTLLTALGVFGLVGTAYLTGKASYRASDLIREETELLKAEEQEGYTKQEFKELTPREKVEITWKLYLPAIITGSLSVMAIVGANRIGSRRAAAVTAAYAISERAYDEYRNKVVENIGEKKEQQLRDEIAHERIRRHPLGDQQAIETGGGNDLCYDLWNGRYFWCSMEAIKQAQNAINYKINHHSHATLTDFYDRLGLDKTKMSDYFGWSLDEQLELGFSTTVSDKGQPVLVMDFLVNPTQGYHKSF
jgi:hypothetical protein